MSRVVTRSYSISSPYRPSRVRLLVLRALQRLQIWLQKQAVLEELHGCDDRTLQDLGISRGDFDAIAAGTYRRWHRDGSEIPDPPREPRRFEIWPYF